MQTKLKEQEITEQTNTKINFSNLEKVEKNYEVKIEEENGLYKVTSNKGVFTVEKPIGGTLNCLCEDEEQCKCAREEESTIDSEKWFYILSKDIEEHLQCGTQLKLYLITLIKLYYENKDTRIVKEDKKKELTEMINKIEEEIKKGNIEISLLKNLISESEKMDVYKMNLRKKLKEIKMKNEKLKNEIENIELYYREFCDKINKKEINLKNLFKYLESNI